MKYKGQTIEKGNRDEVVVFPRQGGNIVIHARPVLDYEPFEKLYPQPVPPKVLKPGGIRSENVEHPTYKKALDEYATRRSHWTILQSLEATEDLEWERVDMAKPETWHLYPEELSEAGFTPYEILRITELVLTACGLNQEKIDEATADFLAGREETQADESSPNTAQSTTQYTKPVKDSESDPQE